MNIYKLFYRLIHARMYSCIENKLYQNMYYCWMRSMYIIYNNRNAIDIYIFMQCTYLYLYICMYSSILYIQITINLLLRKLFTKKNVLCTNQSINLILFYKSNRYIYICILNDFGFFFFSSNRGAYIFLNIYVHRSEI